MSWFRNVVDWAKTIWPSNNTAAIRNYSYSTMSYLFAQANTLPTVVKSIGRDKVLHLFASHIGRVAYEDMLPLALVTYANQLVQELGQTYLESDENNPRLTTAILIQTNLYLLQAATWVYQTRKHTQILIRTTVMALEAPALLNQAREVSHFTVCEEAGCSRMRFVQGSARDIATYYATEAAISLINYVPVAGGIIASTLFVYHRGRYVLTIVLPEVCNRHHVIYLQNNSELALSLGLAHNMSAWFVNQFIETVTGIPQIYFAQGMKELLLFSQMMVASKMQLPQPKQALERSLIDPVTSYQHVIGFMFDVVALGLKTKIPRLLDQNQRGTLKNRLRDLPWARLANLSEHIRHDPKLNIILPRLLRDFSSFIDDPIIGPNWESLQQSLIMALKNIESLSKSKAVRFSSTLPSVASYVTKTVFGTPQFIIKIGLNLLTDPDFIGLVKKLRSEIEELNLTKKYLVEEMDDGTLIISDRKESSKVTPEEKTDTPETLRHRFHSNVDLNAIGDDWVVIENNTSNVSI